MRKSALTAGVTALALALAGAGASAGTASAGTRQPWRVTYVSPETGYDDFGLYDVTATAANDGWAVGSQQQGAGASGAALRWNGTTWSPVTIPGGGGSYGTVNASSRNDVWVTGGNESWHWDGTAWKAVSLGAYDAADVAVVGPKNAWAVGSADEGSDTGEARHWNGTAWKTVAMPFAAHWDGTSWKTSELPAVPIPDGQSGFAYFNDLVALASDDVWAVGRLYWGSGGEEVAADETEHNRPVLMHWNGHAWRLTLGAEGDFALSAGADGQGGIWYASFNKNFVHVATDGTTTTVPVPTPAGRSEAPEIRQIAGVPGGTKVLAVGQIAPAPGGDQSWDAVVEQYH